MALLQSVADKLVAEAKRRKTHLGKVFEFAKRVNLLCVGRRLAPAVSGALLGGTIGGPLGAVIGAVGRLCKADGIRTIQAPVKGDPRPARMARGHEGDAL
jgi:uncharacterized membrane protein